MLQAQVVAENPVQSIADGIFGTHGPHGPHGLPLPGPDGDEDGQAVLEGSVRASLPFARHAQFDFVEATVEIAGQRCKAAVGLINLALFGHPLSLRLSEVVHRDLPGRPRGRLRVLGGAPVRTSTGWAPVPLLRA